MDWDLFDDAVHAEAEEDGGAGFRRVATKEGPHSAKPPSRDEKNRQLALHHANIIEQRKQIENSVLDSTIKLIDYPSSTTSDPAKPSAEDSNAVRQHLRLFQPSDYDELIKERNIEKQCGYVLCPRPHKPIGRVGKFTILQRGRDLQVVNTDEVMRWCSDDCAHRAMYLRVQLSETPAWERIVEHKLELAGEKDGLGSEDAPNTNVDRDAVAKVAEDLKKLALERGNPTADKLMANVQEKTASMKI